MSTTNTHIRHRLHQQYEQLREQVVDRSLEDLVQVQLNQTQSSKWDLNDDELLSADVAQAIAMEELTSLLDRDHYRQLYAHAQQVLEEEPTQELKDGLHDDLSESIMIVLSHMKGADAQPLSGLLVDTDFDFLGTLYGWSGEVFTCAEQGSEWVTPPGAHALFSEIGRVNFSPLMRPMLELQSIDDFLIVEQDFRSDFAQAYQLRAFLLLHDLMRDMQSSGYFDYLNCADPCYFYAATDTRMSYCIYRM